MDSSPAHQPGKACSRSVCPKGSVLPVTVSLSWSTQGWTLGPETPRLAALDSKEMYVPFPA